MNVPALQNMYSVYDEVAGHIRRYDKKTLLEELEGFNISIADIRYWGMFMLPVLLMRTLAFSLNPPETKDVIRRGLQPPNEIINKVFQLIMKIETTIISKPPLGTSILLGGRKL